MKIDDLEKRVQDYRAAAIETSLRNDPEKANQAHDRLHKLYKSLCTTSDGREAIARLMADSDPNVRLWAASHSLFWKPDDARRVLEQIAACGGLLAFDAEMVLKQFDAGRLTFDY